MPNETISTKPQPFREHIERQIKFWEERAEFHQSGLDRARQYAAEDREKLAKIDAMEPRP